MNDKILPVTPELSLISLKGPKLTFFTLSGEAKLKNKLQCLPMAEACRTHLYSYGHVSTVSKASIKSTQLFLKTVIHLFEVKRRFMSAFASYSFLSSIQDEKFL